MNKHKAMRIPDRIYQNNKNLFVAINPRNACKMEFSGHLWLPFPDQLQSDVVVFAIIYFGVYKNLLTAWKHGTSSTDLITLNETFDNLSTAIVELTHIY